MAEAYVSPEGVVTIPKAVLRTLGLKNGGKVEFLPDLEGMVLLIARNVSPQVLAGILPGPGGDCAAEEMIDLAIKRAMTAKKW